MKRLIPLGIIALLIVASLSIMAPVTGAQNTPGSNVHILFDGKNATVRITVNGTKYFYLEFSKLYISSTPNFIRHMGSETLKDMKVKRATGYNELMGNYTKVTMWKDFTFQSKMHHGNAGKDVKVHIAFDFYISDKNYTKKGVNITRNMIRYDTRITTSSRNTFIFLEERMNYGEGENHRMGRVFECNKTTHDWKTMKTTHEVMSHHFGKDHLGVIGFGSKNVSFRYMWEYQSNVETLYSYDGSNFALYFIFKNSNGSVIQDPYITLPVPILGNVSAVVHGIEHVVNYLIDHALSLGIGLALAAVLIFSAPVLRRRRL